MTILPAVLGALSVALISSSVLWRLRPAPPPPLTTPRPTLAQFDDSVIPRTVH